MAKKLIQYEFKVIEEGKIVKKSLTATNHIYCRQLIREQYGDSYISGSIKRCSLRNNNPQINNN